MTENHVPVEIEPLQRTAVGRPPETVMDLAIRENLPVRSDCGGKGRCGKCLVMVAPMESVSRPTDAEIEALPRKRLSENVRLACQTRIEGPLTVRIPNQSLDLAAGGGKRIHRAAYPLNPMVKRIFVPKASLPSDADTARDISDWLAGRLNDAAGTDSAAFTPEMLRRVGLPNDPETDFTVTVHTTRGPTKLTAGKSQRSLGLAVDIGTTSIAAYLCDFKTGRVLGSGSIANPQRPYGEDVISRIAFANGGEKNLEILRKRSAAAVSELAAWCAAQSAAGPEDIDEVTVVGNTAMEQIFCGVHPRNLGRAPFQPINREPVYMTAGDAELSLNPGTPVYIFPVVAGFVGGDTLGAVLADKPHLRKEMNLIVDIGTNGELVMGNRDGLWAASCATGPAFEGAHISCGMRAVPGAISGLDIDGSAGKVTYEVIGEGPDVRPLGLCGSGIIDAAAALRRREIILEGGGFQANVPGVIYDEAGVGREMVLVPKEDTATGMSISITLGDIRQIQLAKAALAVGIEFLVRQVGRTPERIVLTGAFGAGFNWRNALAVGLLPDFVASGKVFPMDNLAGVGAVMALLDTGARDEIEGIYRSVRHVDLAREPDFQHRLMKHMSFPPAGPISDV